jgi:hypothetical protein
LFHTNIQTGIGISAIVTSRSHHRQNQQGKATPFPVPAIREADCDSVMYKIFIGFSLSKRATNRNRSDVIVKENLSTKTVG